MTATAPSKVVTFVCAGMYILSGICQPLIMTLCKQAGLADPTAQLYMFFYFLGPALVLLTFFCDGRKEQQLQQAGPMVTSSSSSSNKKSALTMSAAIAAFDIIAATMNYTGASLAGPTIFAIVYSSVTIWTAVFSRVILGRQLTILQWAAVFTVFGGLCITATDSTHLGPAVIRGTVLVIIGSMMHGATYVMNEAIMTVTHQQLTIRENAAVQGVTAAGLMGVWQCVYTIPRYQTLIATPVHEANTSLVTAVLILCAFMVANLVHSLTYYHTLKYYEGGATSAGVMKGLQAVLVFVACHLLYCDRVGGKEMCFTFAKFLSLITVSGGVALFGYLTEQLSRQRGGAPIPKKEGYITIQNGSDDYGIANGPGPAEVEVEEFHV